MNGELRPAAGCQVFAVVDLANLCSFHQIPTIDATILRSGEDHLVCLIKDGLDAVLFVDVTCPRKRVPRGPGLQRESCRCNSPL